MEVTDSRATMLHVKINRTDIEASYILSLFGNRTKGVFANIEVWGNRLFSLVE